MSSNINSIQSTLERSQNLHDSKAALYEYYDSTIRPDGTNIREIRDINSTLNMYYDTLKWIENAAVDLRFQTEEVEEKINNAGGGPVDRNEGVYGFYGHRY